MGDSRVSLRFAYADPPYIGCAQLYPEHPVRVAYTWEPVIWKRTAERREGDPVGRDHLRCPITMRKGLTGAKPEEFCRWVLVLLGWQPGDVVDDLFPGTGVMGRIAGELR